MSFCLRAFPDEVTQAQRLADALDVALGLVETHVFPDGEILPRVPAADSTTVIYRSLNEPNRKLIELLLTADACRQMGAKQLVLVAPYLPYMRQDKAFEPGQPVSQRVISELLDRVFDRIITVDPHLHRIRRLEEAFPTTQCTNLHGGDALTAQLLGAADPKRWLVVGPDSESAPWVRHIAGALKLECATLEKIRKGDLSVVISLPAGLPLSGRPILLVDDVCSSGTTIQEAIRQLKSFGSGPVTVFVTHALYSDGVADKLRAAGAVRILSTDSCSHATNAIPLASLLASALAVER
ncbi:Phosphoribosylpyrophosphate synthetase [uncultured Defluviicoccus sp.]|uniref:Phosphoribosylpyrophosphate synthetase n=1 Tax=metagenome TaxID=256318 RepID=A0A380T9J3_9ZZZZ|nr:Phosphoribosylpyrophosphate synthetase [uncultured Defluviicoccus sp.]